MQLKWPLSPLKQGLTFFNVLLRTQSLSILIHLFSILEGLCFTSGNKKLYFYWIPSHIGITFNEKADSLAKEASCTNISPDILVLFFNFSHSFRKQAKTETEYLVI